MTHRILNSKTLNSKQENLKRRPGCSTFERLSRHIFEVAVLAVLIFTGTSAFCDSVTRKTARQVAQNKIVQHVSLYGHWNHSSSPTISGEQVIYHESEPVAYNFSVDPSGHILVAVDDFFSPVLLYSTTSTIDAGRLDDPKNIESWILPELGHQVRTLNQVRATTTESTARALTVSETAQRISAAWQLLADPDNSDSVSRPPSTSSLESSAVITVGPLLVTAWGQGPPYNLMAPENNCPGDEKTVTGCVATALAQLMRYWQWPVQGTDSHQYEWNEQTLSADFGATTYDWNNMPDKLDGSTTPEQEAVALLMYHTGIAAEMDFGCETSGSYAIAKNVLDVYFGYKNTMTLLYRFNNNYSSSTWFSFIKTELDADPPRPVLLVIFETGGGGHEAVIDGYQTDVGSDLVHINFGWDGYADGFYDITSQFETEPETYTWEANDQYIVAGIEPNEPPILIISVNQPVVEEETLVQLNGSATDPDGAGIRDFIWSQTDGPTVILSDTNATAPNTGTTATTFTAPNVHEQTQLVFSLRATDVNQGVTIKTTTITVNNTDGSTATVPRSSGGDGSSSGCFLGILLE